MPPCEKKNAACLPSRVLTKIGLILSQILQVEMKLEKNIRVHVFRKKKEIYIIIIILIKCDLITATIVSLVYIYTHTVKRKMHLIYPAISWQKTLITCS